MARILGSLDCVVLPAADVAALVAAYRVVFDAAPIEETYPHGARMRLANVDVCIRQDQRQAGRPAQTPAAVFRVHDIAALRAHLQESGFTPDAEYEAIPGAVQLRFRDPAGNVLAAVQWGARLGEIGAP